MEYIEITKDLFNRITKDAPFKVEELELMFREHYIVDSVKLMLIHNYTGSITQYYIRDINA